MVCNITEQNSTKFFQIFPLGPKMALPRDHMIYIGLFRGKHEKIFLSKTIRPRAFIFGMNHNLMNLYHVCSKDTPGAKMCPAPGVTCLKICLYRETIEKSSCQKP